jgi:hypothetical protein
VCSAKRRREEKTAKEFLEFQERKPKGEDNFVEFFSVDKRVNLATHVPVPLIIVALIKVLHFAQ